ncbi:P-loop containing nucleoside triphosphate hydrolase protein [Mycena galopus ATCC 62051]|nr:P-loop containing nucleoside triphosphate hydrolase protein [Mycena galopus ATCC 62051]
MAEKHAQLVYISPEMALSDRFGRLWIDGKFRARVNALIVDEAHCIDEWGEEFRPVYRQLHRLRSFTGQEVPFVACTATCATSTFNVIWDSLGFGHRPFWGLDAGSDRANLFFSTRTLSNAKNPTLDVLDLLPADLDETSQPSDIPKILAYHGSVAETGKGKTTWRRALPAHLRGCVVAYSSGISEAAGKDVWEGFSSGRYRILCATDAAGMGCNAPDVEYSIVFECPRSLAVLVQRWGRAGRSRTGQSGSQCRGLKGRRSLSLSWRLTLPHAPNSSRISKHSSTRVLLKMRALTLSSQHFFVLILDSISTRA